MSDNDFFTVCCVVELVYLCYFFFFFQAEDGIRDDLVTGVQTCALPISTTRTVRPSCWQPKARGNPPSSSSPRSPGGADGTSRAFISASTTGTPPIRRKTPSSRRTSTAG